MPTGHWHEKKRPISFSLRPSVMTALRHYYRFRSVDSSRGTGNHYSLSAAANELLDDALSYNQRLWTLLQSELARPDNPLPENVRFDILRLSRFIDKRIYETMAFPAPEKLDIIIKINQNLAAGLRGAPA